MYHLETTGSWDNFKKWADKIANQGVSITGLEKFGQMGVDALAKATPIESGKTAGSWEYRLVGGAKDPGIEWINTNVVSGEVIALLIQYGHGTGTGGYIHGIDYINPAIRPIFEQIAEELWKQVNT